MSLAVSPFESASDRGVARVSRESDRAVVWLRGEHDIATTVELSETMARAIALDEPGVVVDLSGVHFMGAATVGVIVRAREFLHRQERSFEVRDPSMCAKRILGLCGLDGLFEADGSPPATSLKSWIGTDRASRVTVPRRRPPPDVQRRDDQAPERVVARNGS